VERAELAVVFANQVDPGSGYFATQFAALRVSPLGTVLDPSPIAIALDHTSGGFAVGSDGVGWVVTYTGYSAGNSNGLALLASGAELMGTRQPALGVVLHVDLRSALLVGAPVAANAAGIGELALPIPPTPALAGARLWAQSLWSWGGSCPLPPLGLSLGRARGRRPIAGTPAVSASRTPSGTPARPDPPRRRSRA
jgi:hypothetical protein